MFVLVDEHGAKMFDRLERGARSKPILEAIRKSFNGKVLRSIEPRTKMFFIAEDPTQSVVSGARRNELDWENFGILSLEDGPECFARQREGDCVVDVVEVREYFAKYFD